MELITDSRVINWYGIYRPPSDAGRIFYSRAWIDILQLPRSVYENYRFSPPQSFYGHVIALGGERVVWNRQIEWVNQLVWEYHDYPDLLHRSLVCHLDSVHQSIINLGVSLNALPIQVNNPIADRVVPVTDVNEFRIRLLTVDTVARFTFEYYLSPSCSVGLSPPPPPPPDYPPPPPVPVLPPPPGEGLNPELPPISPAYDGGDDDGLTYSPEPPVEPPIDFPVGENCQEVTVTASYTDGNGDRVTFSQVHYGSVEGFEVVPSPGGVGTFDLLITSRGNNPFAGCSSLDSYIMVQGGLDITVDSVVPEPI